MHVVNRIPKRATRAMKRWYKRRSCIEPTIGNLKTDHRMNRNYLKGEMDDRINATLAAAGYNFTKLLAWFCWAQTKLKSWVESLLTNITKYLHFRWNDIQLFGYFIADGG